MSRLVIGSPGSLSRAKDETLRALAEGRAVELRIYPACYAELAPGPVLTPDALALSAILSEAILVRRLPTRIGFEEIVGSALYAFVVSIGEPSPEGVPDGAA